MNTPRVSLRLKLALLALPLLAWAWRARRQRSSAWRGRVDPHLLPHLLAKGGTASWRGPAVAAAAFALAVLALAGPSWRQGEQPLWQSKAPLVVVLDLSQRIGAADLPPSRLLQARAKLARLLQARSGGQVALVAYADDAFTVAPLTQDNANVALYLDDLSPEVMPVDGQRADRGIAWASRLLQQAKSSQGDILLLTDRADAAARAAAAKARAQGYRVSVLGLGTAAGAAYQGADGAIGHAALDAASLRALASAGGGQYRTLSAGDGDLEALGVLLPAQAEAAGPQGGTRTWRDEGYWLLPPLMLLGLLAFRRGVMAVAALGLLLPLASPAHAAGADWWQRADQRQQARIEQGVAAYRQGDFAVAEQAFAGIDTAEGWYNLGNALAKQQRYDDAIAAYDRALRRQPGMEDAIANRKAVDAARKRPPSGDGQGRQGQQGQQGQQGKQDPQSPQGRQNPQDQQQNRQGRQSQQDAQDPQNPQAPASPPRQDTPPSSAPDTAKPGTPPPSSPADTAQQSEADAAQRERMRQAMAQQAANGAQRPPQDGAAVAAETPEQRERRQAVDAWLKRVPDEPGSLLKAKFRLEHERRQREGR